MNPRLLLLLPLCLIPLAFRSPAPAAAAPSAGAWKVDAVHSSVLFRIKHVGTSWTIGRFNGISGEITLDEAKPENCKVAIEIDPSTVDTNCKPREDHLRSADFFSVKEFPKISFASTKVAKSGDKYSVTGDLTLHGVARPVTLATTFNGGLQHPLENAYAIGFSAATKLDIADFNFPDVDWKIFIADDVSLKIEAEFIAEK